MTTRELAQNEFLLLSERCFLSDNAELLVELIICQYTVAHMIGELYIPSSRMRWKNNTGAGLSDQDSGYGNSFTVSRTPPPIFQSALGQAAHRIQSELAI